jgi:lycopene beta-cyclase
MPRKAEYDYIICGAGCSGLSLVMHMIASRRFGDQKILIIDKAVKNQNDRTWCFWEKESGLFEPIVYKRWQQFWLYGTDSSHLLSIAPYQYKLIRGIDFYNYCLDAIKRQPNISFLQAGINEIVNDEHGACVVADGQRIHCRYVFNSTVQAKPQLKEHHYWLLQHFKGWLVETEKDVFDATAATFMDFRTSQEKGCTFFYVLPFSNRKALIEYTLFSGNLLQDKDYDAALKNYIEVHLGIKAYTIEATESGIIPMTNFPFVPRQGNIINIGTAGGQTKGSSGFTFRFIQKHSKAIVESLLHNGNPFSVPPQSSRYRFYDSVLLHILQHQMVAGATIFSTLFEKNIPASVLKFLDNETSLSEELSLISTLPTIPFLKAALRHVIK